MGLTHVIDSSISSAAWVSEGRYTVVDLSAGPVVYGPSDVGEGAVTAGTYPFITPSKPNRSAA